MIPIPITGLSRDKTEISLLSLEPSSALIPVLVKVNYQVQIRVRTKALISEHSK